MVRTNLFVHSLRLSINGSPKCVLHVKFLAAQKPILSIEEGTISKGSGAPASSTGLPVPSKTPVDKTWRVVDKKGKSKPSAIW